MGNISSNKKTRITPVSAKDREAIDKQNLHAMEKFITNAYKYFSEVEAVKVLLTSSSAKDALKGYLYITTHHNIIELFDYIKGILITIIHNKAEEEFKSNGGLLTARSTTGGGGVNNNSSVLMSSSIDSQSSNEHGKQSNKKKKKLASSSTSSKSGRSLLSKGTGIVSRLFGDLSPRGQLSTIFSNNNSNKVGDISPTSVTWNNSSHKNFSFDSHSHHHPESCLPPTTTTTADDPNPHHLDATEKEQFLLRDMLKQRLISSEGGSSRVMEFYLSNRSSSKSSIYHSEDLDEVIQQPYITTQWTMGDVRSLYHNLYHMTATYIGKDSCRTVSYISHTDEVICVQLQSLFHQFIEGHSDLDDKCNLGHVIDDNISYIIGRVDYIYASFFPELLEVCIKVIAKYFFLDFVSSKYYNMWRIQERSHALAASVQDAVDAAQTKNDYMETGVVFSSVRYPGGELPPKMRTQISHRLSDFAMRAFLSMREEDLSKILIIGNWLASFLSACEALPVGVTLISVTPTTQSSSSSSLKDYNIIYVNRYYEKFTEYNRKELLGNEMESLFMTDHDTEKCYSFSNKNDFAEAPPTVSSPIHSFLVTPDCKKHQSRQAVVIKTKKRLDMYQFFNKGNIHICVLSNKTKSGTSYEHLSAWKPLFNEAGQCIYLLGFHIDVTNASRLSTDSGLPGRSTELTNVVAFSTYKYFRDVFHFLPDEVLTEAE